MRGGAAAGRRSGAEAGAVRRCGWRAAPRSAQSAAGAGGAGHGEGGHEGLLGRGQAARPGVAGRGRCWASRAGSVSHGESPWRSGARGAGVRGAQDVRPEGLAPPLAVPAPVVGDELWQPLGADAGLGERLDGGGDVVDLLVVEALARLVAGERGLGDGGEQAGRVAGGRRLGGQPLAWRAHHAASGGAGPSPPKSTATSPLPSGAVVSVAACAAVGVPVSASAVGAAGCAASSVPRPGPCRPRARRGRGSSPRSRADGVGAHARPVAVAQPLLGLGRQHEQVALALPADALHLAGARADRQHDGGERGVQVGADAGGDGGALARVASRAPSGRPASRRPVSPMSS